MEIVYTRHARGRMRWRAILKHEVEQTIKEPERREMIGSDRYHLYRNFGKKHIRVTCVVEGSKLIVISAVDKSD